jgi:predicted cation transporter
MVDDNLTWNNHIDQLISKLNSACYAMRAVNALLSRKGLRMLIFSYVHSIISHGIILGGNIPNSIKIFRIRKTRFKNYE